MHLNNSTLQDEQNGLCKSNLYIAVGMRYEFFKNQEVSKFQKFKISPYNMKIEASDK